jgi:DNA-binding transcriptional ArsR family regulator
MKERKDSPAVFLAISDPTRRQILTLLTGGALTVSALAANFDVSRPAISKHIKVLEQAQLISIQEAGRERYCRLDPTGFEEIKDWLAFYESFWIAKMKQFDKVLNAHSKKNSRK